MKWYNADKKKPYSSEKVLIYPSVVPTAYWDKKKEVWISGMYPLPAYPCEVRVQKWAYINYPKKSLEYKECSRNWEPWWKKMFFSFFPQKNEKQLKL
jgi:hypothetical protein